jgi:RNA polymerase sigma-70 factor (ECF subfamily)
MSAPSNSAETSRLLLEAGHDAVARQALLARHRERLRRMVRLRLDRRVPGRFSSSVVLDEVFHEAERRWLEYQGNPELSFFLWLRQLAGERIQAIHQQHLGGAWQGGEEIVLYRHAMPRLNTVSLAAQLVGNVPASPLGRADLQIYLQEALNQMDPVDREVLALCHFEELNNDEAAAVLGLDRGETSRRYVQAVKALKTILDQIPGFFRNRGAPTSTG